MDYIEYITETDETQESPEYIADETHESYVEPVDKIVFERLPTEFVRNDDGVVPWEDVTKSWEYKELPDGRKAEAVVSYFDNSIAPLYSEEEYTPMRSQFLKSANEQRMKDEVPGFLNDIVSEAMEATKSSAGAIIGLANSPLAAIWGTLSTQPHDDEEFSELSFEEQVIESAIGGLVGGAKSATESVFKKGSWGSNYGDYYKHWKGKTLQEDLPDKLKPAAGAIEISVDIISDPLMWLTVGATGLAKMPAKVGLAKLEDQYVVKNAGPIIKALRKLDIPKGWKGKLPPEIEKQFRYLDKLEDKEKREAVLTLRRLLDEKAKETYGGERALTAEELGVQKVEREVPELTKQIEESKMLGKKPPVVVDQTISKIKIDTFLKEKELPIKDVPKEELKLHKIDKNIDKLNVFRKSKGLDPIKKPGEEGFLDLKVVKESIDKLDDKVNDFLYDNFNVFKGDKEQLRNALANRSVKEIDDLFTELDKIVVYDDETNKMYGVLKNKIIKHYNEIQAEVDKLKNDFGLDPSPAQEKYIRDTAAVFEAEHIKISTTRGIPALKTDINIHMKQRLADKLLEAGVNKRKVTTALERSTTEYRREKERLTPYPGHAETRIITEKPPTFYEGYKELSKVHGMVGKVERKASVKSVVSSLDKLFFDRIGQMEAASPKTYEQMIIYKSYKDRAQYNFNILGESLSPTINTKNKQKLFSDYILAHRSQTRSIRGIDNPTGLTKTEADRAIKQAELLWKKQGGNVSELRQARDIFQKWTHDTMLKPMLDNGFITKQAYDEIKQGNNWYATFDVLQSLPNELTSIPTGLKSSEYFSVANQNVIKTMIGTESHISDPLIATVEKSANVQRMIAKNKIASTFVDDPGMRPYLRPVVDSKKKFKILESQGKHPIMEGTWDKLNYDTVSRFRNGRVETYVADKFLIDTMKNISTHQAPRLVQKFSGLFRAAATTKNLAFAIGNASRDFLTAYMSSYKPLDIFGKMQKDWFMGAKEAIKRRLGKTNLVDEYLNAGGGFGYAQAGGEAFDISKMKVEGKLFRTTKGKVIDMINPFQWIDTINEVIEAAPRTGLYRRKVLLEGLDPTTAAVMGRKATIDFNRGGTLLKVLNSYTPFINARFQGSKIMYESAKKNPKEFAAKLGVLTTTAALPTYYWNTMMFPELYRDIPSDIKKDNFIVIYGSTTDEKTGREVPKYIKIAKGDFGQIASNPIESFLENLKSEDRESWEKLGLNTLVDIGYDISPVRISKAGKFSPSRVVGSLLPQLAKIPIEPIVNYNFYYGTDIVPDWMDKQYSDVPELKYKENTPELYKVLGDLIGVSPLKLQNIGGNTFASYGRDASLSAYWEGLKGRIVSTRAGDITAQAYTAQIGIQKGYNGARVIIQKALEEGDHEKAIELMNQWDEKVPELVEKYRDKFNKYEFLSDKGGLIRDFSFRDYKKRMRLFKSANQEKTPYYQKHLAPKKRR